MGGGHTGGGWVSHQGGHTVQGQLWPVFKWDWCSPYSMDIGDAGCWERLCSSCCEVRRSRPQPIPALCFGCSGGYRALFVDFLLKLEVGAIPLGSTCILRATLCGVSKHRSRTPRDPGTPCGPKSILHPSRRLKMFIQQQTLYWGALQWPVPTRVVHPLPPAAPGDERSRGVVWR